MESAAPASRLHQLPLQGSSSSTTPSSRSATLQSLPLNPGYPGPSQPRPQAFARSSNSMQQSSRVAYQSTFRPAVATRENPKVPQSAVQAPFQQRNSHTAPRQNRNPGEHPIRPQAAPPRSFPNATYVAIPTSNSFPLMTSDVRTRITINDRREERTSR
jgi:hypothetical protein